MATRHKRGGASKKHFKVKLDLYFKRSVSPEEDDFTFSGESPQAQQAILDDYNATVEHYETHEIEDAVKQFDVNQFTENLYPEGRIIPGSAQWIDGEFAVEFVVEASPTTTAERVAQDLYMNSLEDGEYGSIDSNGWSMKTLNNEWEYGTTDYREHERIHVTPLDQIGGKRRKTRRQRLSVSRGGVRTGTTNNFAYVISVPFRVVSRRNNGTTNTGNVNVAQLNARDATNNIIDSAGLNPCTVLHAEFTTGTDPGQVFLVFSLETDEDQRSVIYDSIDNYYSINPEFMTTRQGVLRYTWGNLLVDFMPYSPTAANNIYRRPTRPGGANRPRAGGGSRRRRNRRKTRKSRK